MAAAEDELKAQLDEVGAKLQKPHGSVKDLLALLDRVEVYLSRVEQSPSKAIQTALTPTQKALVGEKLLRHVDVDVKVAVASCISEITRITAPEVPYEDDQMREVFQLIVSSFESLADNASVSYNKRTSILETVAKVRSCVVMLDLECDALILEMFRHFIKAIRDYHPENVYSCMESIMIRVIEESEDISSDLLHCILETVKKDNKEVAAVARKLMETVIETCSDKLRPYVAPFVRTRGLSLTDYSEVVNRISNGTAAETVAQTDKTDAAEALVTASKLAQPLPDTPQITEETRDASVNSIEKPPAGDGHIMLVSSNGAADAKVDAASGSCTVQDQESSNVVKPSEAANTRPLVEVSYSDSAKEVEPDLISPEAVVDPETKVGNMDNDKVDEQKSNSEAMPEKIVKKRGRKPKAKKNALLSGTSAKSRSGAAEKLNEQPDSQKSFGTDTCQSPQEKSNEAGVRSAADYQVSSSKPLETDDVPSKEVSFEIGEPDRKLTSHSESKAAVSISENKKFEIEKARIAAVSVPEEIDLTACASEVKSVISTDAVENIRAPDVEELRNDAPPISGERTQEVADPVEDEHMEDAESSDLEAKSLEEPGARLNEDHEMEVGYPRIKDEVKRRGRGLGKSSLKKIATQTSNLDVNKEAIASPKSASKPVKIVEESEETPKISSKRKHTGVNKSGTKGYGPEVVGAHVKIWWPADQRFYKGVIESFDPDRNRHKVLYADGETEDLVLKRQTWAVINPGDASDSEEDSDQETPDDASGKRQKGKEVDEGTSSSGKRLGRLPSNKSKSTTNKQRQKGKEVVEGTSSSGKRLGRPPSNKSNSATNKRGSKPTDLASDSKSRVESKSDVKTKTEGSKDNAKPKGETVKKVGRPRADASHSGGKEKTDVSSSKTAGKSKADESKRTAKSATDDAKSSGKIKIGVSKTGSKGRDESKAAIKPDVETSVKKKNAKGRDARSVDETSALKSAGKPLTSEPSKLKNGSTAKQETPKAASSANKKGKSPKPSNKTDVKAPEKADSSSSDSEASGDVEEKTPAPAKTATSSKRKQPDSKKGSKSGTKSRKKMKGGK